MNAVAVTQQTKNNHRVTQANVLIEACYKMTLEEKRLVVLAISKINPFEEVPTKILITAQDYARIFEITPQGAYQQLRDASERLWERELRFKNEGEEGKQRWVDRVSYLQKKATVSLSFSAHLHPYLSQLSGSFGSYGIASIGLLKSIYSVRLYELLIQYIAEKKRFITIKDLRSMFDLEDKYELYSDLRKVVIEPAVKEVKDKTNLDVSYTPEKVGRSVVRLWFHFEEKKQGTLNFAAK